MTFIRSMAVLAALILAGCDAAGTVPTTTPTGATGKPKWAQTVSADNANADSQLQAVTTDSWGNVYAAGFIYGTTVCDFGSGVTAAGSYASATSMVVVSYGPTGVPVWAQTVSGSAYSTAYGITTDSSGNVYVVGLMRGTGSFDFGNGVTAAGTYSADNAFVVKYNSKGTAQWAQTVASGSSYSQFNAVATDSSGNVYAAGQINGTGTFGFGNSITAAGASSNYYSVVLVKYNSSGTAQWAQSASAGSSHNIYQGVAVDGSGNIYAAGFTYGSGSFTFGTGVTATGTATGGSNVLLVKYDSTGTAQWAQTLTSGSMGSKFNAVTVDKYGSVYAVGNIYSAGPWGFGNGVSLTGTVNDNEAVVVKYYPWGKAQWARTVSQGTAGSYFYGVTTDSWGNIYAAGTINGQLSFGSGVTAAPTFTSDTNVALVKYNASGTAQWAKTASGTYHSGFNAVTADASGNLYAAGFIGGTSPLDFGNGATATFTNSGDGVALVRYQ
jgi:hypothetical protein